MIEAAGGADDPFGGTGLDLCAGLLENKKVKLEYDVDAGDTSSGYLNAYVYLPDGRMANAELLRMGFVKLRIIPAKCQIRR